MPLHVSSFRAPSGTETSCLRRTEMTPVGSSTPLVACDSHPADPGALPRGAKLASARFDASDSPTWKPAQPLAIGGPLQDARGIQRASGAHAPGSSPYRWNPLFVGVDRHGVADRLLLHCDYLWLQAAYRVSTPDAKRASADPTGNERHSQFPSVTPERRITGVCETASRVPRRASSKRPGLRVPSAGHVLNVGRNDGSGRYRSPQARGGRRWPPRRRGSRPGTAERPPTLGDRRTDVAHGAVGGGSDALETRFGLRRLPLFAWARRRPHALIARKAAAQRIQPSCLGSRIGAGESSAGELLP